MTKITRQTTGILCLATGIIAVYWGSGAMFTFSPDATFSWLLMVGFGAAILLLVGGILTLFPRIRRTWLLALVAVILAAFWAVFLREFSISYCVFVAALMLVSWATLAWAYASNRPAIVAFIGSLTLALFWLPVSVSVLHPTAFFASVAANGPIFALCTLIIAASVLSGIASFRSGRTR